MELKQRNGVLTLNMEEFENTPEFQALVVAASAKPERRMGESVIQAEPPQWKEVKRLALKLLKSNPDQLSVHIFLIQAEASVSGFRGFLDALQKLLTLLEDQWDSLQPAADLEDPDDKYYARINLVSELSYQPEFLDNIYRLPLVSVRAIGSFSTRDLDISAGNVTATSEEQVRCQDGLVRGAFAESEPADLSSMADTLNELTGICQSIGAIVAQRTDQPDLTVLDPLQKKLEHCLQQFMHYAEEHLLVEPVDEPQAGSDLADAQSARRSRVSSIADRSMATDAFNAVLLYYQRHEPSSPVRVLTANAREFVNKSFFEVLQAMAPNYQDNLPVLLRHLCEQPLSSLLSDSYTRYLAGDGLPVLENVADEAEVPLTQAPHDPPILHGPPAPVNADPEKAVNHGVTGKSVAASPSDKNPQSFVIDSRQQVLEVLEDIEIFFTNAEPASPIPLIISDIRKLVSKSFINLLEDFSRRLPPEPVSE